MTTPSTIAVMVIAVAILIGSFIGVIFLIIDTVVSHYKEKKCNHLCIFCKYRKKCDWYGNYMNKK